MFPLIEAFDKVDQEEGSPSSVKTEVGDTIKYGLDLDHISKICKLDQDKIIHLH